LKKLFDAGTIEEIISVLPLKKGQSPHSDARQKMAEVHAEKEGEIAEPCDWQTAQEGKNAQKETGPDQRQNLPDRSLHKPA